MAIEVEGVSSATEDLADHGFTSAVLDGDISRAAGDAHTTITKVTCSYLTHPTIGGVADGDGVVGMGFIYEVSALFQVWVIFGNQHEILYAALFSPFFFAVFGNITAAPA